MMRVYGIFFDNVVQVLSCEALPDGDKVLTIPVNDGWDSVRKLPGGLQYEGIAYGFTGWNSDTNVAYYKTSKKFAKECK